MTSHRNCTHTVKQMKIQQKPNLQPIKLVVTVPEKNQEPQLLQNHIKARTLILQKYGTQTEKQAG